MNLTRGDKVRIGNGNAVWTVAGVYPIGPDGKRVGEAQWATVTIRTNRHGIWTDQVKYIRDLSRLTRIEN